MVVSTSRPRRIFFYFAAIAIVVGILVKHFYQVPTTQIEPSVDGSDGELAERKRSEARQDRVAPPDFSAIANSAAKKKAFFDYLKPTVDQLNQKISQQRLAVQAVYQAVANKQALTPKQKVFVTALAGQYKINAFQSDNLSQLKTLLIRLDVIPISMVFAQAANESAWGTSRFAQQGNNFFGQWCYTPGCGIVPKRRPPNAVYEVAEFLTVEESVAAYFRNINTNPAYRKVRKIRAHARNQGKRPCGFRLVEGLVSYSSRGWDYILDLQAIIRVNNLIEYDRI